VRVLHGLPLGLDRTAVEAIQQWRFKPALQGDKPVKVYLTLTVIFSLKR
jgi:protein TonB